MEYFIGIEIALHYQNIMVSCGLFRVEGGGGENHVLCSSQSAWLYELRGYERLDLCWKALLSVRSEKVMLILCMCGETYEKVIIGCTHATCMQGTGGVAHIGERGQIIPDFILFSNA